MRFLRYIKYFLLFLAFIQAAPVHGQLIVNGWRYNNTPSYDPDAQAYFDVLDDYVSPSTQQKDDINTFIVNAKANGWWGTRLAVYFPVWSNASANSINLKNPGTYDLTLVGSPTSDGSGIAWNGTSQYAQTGINGDDLDQNSVSFFVYSQTASTTVGADIGVTNPTGPVNLTFFIVGSGVNDNIIAFLNRQTGQTVSRGADSRGGFATSRIASNDQRVYRNGAQLGSVFSSASSTPPPGEIFLGARNLIGTGANVYCNRKHSYADIGAGLTSGEEADHYTDVQALHTAFSIAQ